MTSFDRRQKILDLVRRDGSVSVHALVEALGTSQATLRRDLIQLEQENKLVRTHGGVLHPRQLAAEPTFSVKQQLAPEIKQKIGRALVASISAGTTVYVDSGTTCLEAGLALLERNENILYTNSLPLLYHGCSQPGRVIAIGGEVRPISQALIGDLALGWMKHLRFDYGIIGASALDIDSGVLTTELSEASVKSQILERSNTVILAADSSKVEQQAAVRFATWDAFDQWFTDDGVSSKTIRKFKKQHNLSVITSC